MLQRQLQHAGPKAGQRLRNVRVSAPGNDGQGAGHILPRPQGELLKILSGRFDPCNRPGLACHPLNVVIFANTKSIKFRQRKLVKNWKFMKYRGIIKYWTPWRQDRRKQRDEYRQA